MGGGGVGGGGATRKGRVAAWRVCQQRRRLTWHTLVPSLLCLPGQTSRQAMREAVIELSKLKAGKDRLYSPSHVAAHMLGLREPVWLGSGVKARLPLAPPLQQLLHAWGVAPGMRQGWLGVLLQPGRAPCRELQPQTHRHPSPCIQPVLHKAGAPLADVQPAPAGPPTPHRARCATNCSASGVRMRRNSGGMGAWTATPPTSACTGSMLAASVRDAALLLRVEGQCVARCYRSRGGGGLAWSGGGRQRPGYAAG